MDRDADEAQDARLRRMLEGLLALDAVGFDAAMTQAAQRLAEVLGADKVDVFLHDPATDALVAAGTSDTPMGRREHELGLDRLPLDSDGWTVEVFRNGRSHLARQADRESGEAKRLVEELGVRSSVNVPLDVAGERRGVLLASSATPAFFSELDLRFTEAVARWVGLVAYRSAHVQCLVTQAAEEGARMAAERAAEVLTPRQQEIAALVAGGLSNKQIAERLVLTKGTVANHIEHILRRLDLQSRVQVTRWITELELTGSSRLGANVDR